MDSFTHARLGVNGKLRVLEAYGSDRSTLRWRCVNYVTRLTAMRASAFDVPVGRPYNRRVRTPTATSWGYKMRKMLMIAVLAVVVALAVACGGGSAAPKEQSGHGTAGPTESVSDKAKSPEGMGELICDFLKTHDDETAYVLLHPDDQARLSYYEFAFHQEAALAEAVISDCRVVAVMMLPNWSVPDLGTTYTNVTQVTLRVTLHEHGDQTATDLYPSHLVKVGEYWRWFTDTVRPTPVK